MITNARIVVYEDGSELLQIMCGGIWIDVPRIPWAKTEYAQVKNHDADA